MRAAVISFGAAVLLILTLALPVATGVPANTTSPVTFTDVSRNSGIAFQHDNATSAEKYLIETMGAGAAWLDYDNDGYLDLYLVNGAATKAYVPSHPLGSALYHNNGDGSFTDVTAQAGVAATGLFGMGVAVGDYDNDGFPDLYVTGYGRSVLYRNNGDGTFTDVTAKAHVSNTNKWGSSAAWLDYDRDGRLDLIVANYVDFTPENNRTCVENGHRSYCHPNKYHGQTPTLYHNNGDGTFTDVSAASGIGARAGNGLGVVCFDFNGDGWTDVFIANDSMENFLFINRQNGTFREAGVEAGVAFSEDGKSEAGMGVDAGDYDRDGRLDLFVTHLDLEWNRLYRNRGDGTFDDATFASKIGSGNYHKSGFGTGFIDYDNDGWLDIFIANGHVLDNVQLFHAGTSWAEPKTMYRNTGRSFEEVSNRLGSDFIAPRVGRAAAFADYDNDGDIDILVTNNGQAPQLLRNDGGNRNHWLGVCLIGVRSNRDGVGAKVRVRAGGATQINQAKGGMSYQAAHDPRLHFGLGNAARVESLEVEWPSGAVDKIRDVAADRFVVVKEGAGEVQPCCPPFRDKPAAKPR
jgi:hypothetical protein